MHEHSWDLDQRENAFKQKYQLKQHLKRKHEHEDDQLSSSTSPAKAPKLKLPVYPVDDCEFYCDPEFEDVAFEEQQNSGPFAEQRGYTKHMQKERSWASYIGEGLDLDKIGREDYYSAEDIKPRYEEFLGAENMGFIQFAIDPTTKTGDCDDCQNKFAPFSTAHQKKHYGRGELECGYCHEYMDFRRLKDHQSRHCINQVACLHCHKPMQSRHLKEHEEAHCTAMGKCSKCLNWVEHRRMRWGNFCEPCSWRAV